ncbi:MAG: hypothetical protein CMJ83_10000 [Planctomycetes bacterium]|nr:hypothetical protein [Planctomycetota bacterium]
MTAILALCLVIVSPAAGPKGMTSSEKAKAKKIVARYFKERDDAKRAAILKELEPLDHPTFQDLKGLRKAYFKLARRGLPRVRGKNPHTCLHPDYPGTYTMRVPSRARSGTKTGVFISLHGGGEGVGDGAQIERIFGLPDSKLICVYPTVVRKVTAAWNKAEGERYVVSILDELKRTYKIDTNRVYLAGHSMGGYGTWSIGGKHADLFAAASAMAGGTFERGIVPHYRNLPLWVYNAEDDNRVRPDSSKRAMKRIDEELRPRYGGYETVFHLYPRKDRIGHGFPKKSGHDVKSIFSWMLKRKRNPRPDRVVFEPTLRWKRRMYWVGADARSRGILEVRRAKNTFTVGAASGALSLYLDAKLCDLKKAVVVVKEDADGGKTEVFNAIPTPGLRVFVASIGTYNDPELASVARIRVE